MLKHSNRLSDEDEVIDTGFSSNFTGSEQRLLDRNGNFNLKRTGISYLEGLHVYHRLITMSWTRFLMYVFLVYFIENLFFAFVYVLIGDAPLTGMAGKDFSYRFLDAFFFSAQTITTVGYGKIAPETYSASLVAAFESILGLLGFALATGLVYGRFSRPVAKIFYSKNILYSPFKNINCFKFRLTNGRKNQLIEVEARLVVSMTDKETGFKKFYVIDLEYPKINFLALSWTVVHPIDEHSPFHEMTKEEFESRDPEFIVLIKAFDDAFSQTVHSRTSYKHYDVVWNANFEPMFNVTASGAILELDKIDRFKLINKN
ncbi:ion channel [soil metagenome]